jgi:hypothetical protein
VSREADQLRAHLGPGESILWAGKPAQGVLFTSRDILLIPFSIFWLGFVCVWLFGVVSTGAPMEFLLVGMLFLVVGLGVMVGRFALDAFVRANTSYAVTTERVMINREGPFGDFTAIALKRLPTVKLKPRGGGRGTIVLGQSTSPWVQISIWTPSLDPTPQLIAIADAQRVYALIQKQSARIE